MAARLAPTEALEQSLTWEAASLALQGGTAAEAAGLFKGHPFGRPKARFLRRGNWWQAVLVGDLRAIGRAPVRACAAAAGLVAVGLMVAHTQPGSEKVALPPVAVGALAAVIAFAALGPFSRGLTDWSNDVRGQMFFGSSPWAMAAVRLVVPACAGLAGIGLGLWIDPGPAQGALSIGLAAWWAAVWVAARLAESLRGDLTAAMMPTISTPMGDFGPVVTLMWQVDTVAMAAGFGAVSGAFVFAGRPVWPVGLIGLVVCGSEAAYRWYQARP
jgi:hypothetical protein